jgi:hypothetical protein
MVRLISVTYMWIRVMDVPKLAVAIKHRALLAELGKLSV